jgi:hypothetical protein
VSTVDPALLAPWSPDAEDLIRGALRHTYVVYIYPDTAGAPAYLPVTVTSCSVTFDEFWSPYVQGTLTAVIPDAATLAKLDPRLLVVVEVRAGYILPGSVTDRHTICKCLLSRRSVDYPGEQVTLEFQGPEYIVDGTLTTVAGGGPQALAPGGSWTSTTTAAAAMSNVYTSTRLGSLLTFTSLDTDPDGCGPDVGWVDPGAQWVGEFGENHLEVMRDVADRIDAWARVDEYGTFRISRRRWGTPTPAHRLRVGADGTIINSADTLARAAWANAVYLRYEWTVTTSAAGVETVTPKAASAAAYAGGKYDPDVVGMVSVSITRQHHVASSVQATSAALALLRRYSTRANALSVSAVAAYWLRPDAGVSVQLPLGAEQTLRVSAVTFDLDAGRMDVLTRNPEPAALVRVPGPQV